MTISPAFDSFLTVDMRISCSVALLSQKASSSQTKVLSVSDDWFNNLKWQCSIFEMSLIILTDLCKYEKLLNILAHFQIHSCTFLCLFSDPLNLYSLFKTGIRYVLRFFVMSFSFSSSFSAVSYLIKGCFTGNAGRASNALRSCLIFPLQMTFKETVDLTLHCKIVTMWPSKVD